MRTQPRFARLQGSVMLATLLSAISMADAAYAEEQLVDAEFGLGTGLEGGDSGDGLRWRRARSRFVSGLEWRWDEADDQGIGARLFVEVERRAGIGAEVRYVHWATPRFGAYVGGVCLIAPESLWGGGVGARFLVPLGDRASVFIEPSVNAFPLGSDVPDGSVVLWGLLSGGIRVGL